MWWRWLLALSSVACASAPHVVITRDASRTTVAVDAAQLPDSDAGRSARLQELVRQACGAEPGRVMAERVASRREVELDVDEVLAATTRSQARWNSGSTTPSAITPNHDPERARTVEVPVVELSIECGG